jgi:hypothetical protein
VHLSLGDWINNIIGYGRARQSPTISYTDVATNYIFETFIREGDIHGRQQSRARIKALLASKTGARPTFAFRLKALTTDNTECTDWIQKEYPCHPWLSLSVIASLPR